MALSAAEILFERIWKQISYARVEFDLDVYELLGVLDVVKGYILYPEDHDEEYEETPDEANDDTEEETG